jgi:hypothetical protein
MSFAASRSSMAAELLVPDEYPTIQQAIDQAVAGDTVTIEPGAYVENIALKDGISVRGREAARVLLSPDRDGVPTILVASVTSAVVANMTLVGAGVALEVQDSSDVTVASNIFDAAEDTALSTDQMSIVAVVNNVFFGNGTAIRRSSDDTAVTNNVFAGNRVTIASPANIVDDDASVRFNCFFDNDDLTTGGIDTALGATFQIGDPRFADTERRDFHLQQSSPCIDTGSGTDRIDNSVADIGAYGGAFADERPFPVAQPAAQDRSGDQIFALELTWGSNLSYLVTNTQNPGGYRVYYRQNEPGPPFDGVDADDGTQPSPIDTGSVTSFTLENLRPEVASPTAPQLLSAEPRANAVALTWGAVDNVVGYTIRYGVTDLYENRVDVGDLTAHTVGGLANETAYTFAVVARRQATYYVAVTALDNTQVRHESALSEVQSLRLGPIVESADSNQLGAVPQVTIPVPNLPDEGCFIATAAYGADWVAEVQILRDFRDAYLLTHSLGRRLVRAYYAISPEPSRYLNAHPRLKIVVRAGLAPAVGGALLMVASSSSQKLAIGLLVTLLVGVNRLRRRSITHGIARRM